MQKRAFTGQGAAQTPGSGTQMITEDSKTNVLLGPQPISNENLVSLDIDAALEKAQTLSQAEFVQLVQSMEFKVRLVFNSMKLVDFPKLLRLINSNSDVHQFFATVGFRRLLSIEKNPPIQPVIDANLVPRFIHLLSRADLPKLQVLFSLIYLLV